MTRSAISGARASIAALALLGLAACGHFPQSIFASRVRAIPADMGRNSAETVEDRLYEQAVRAIERREYDTALDALQIARESRPDDPRVLNALGVIYDKLGRFDLSERYYDLAEKADPGSKVVAMNRRYSLMMRQATPPVTPDEVTTIAAAVGKPVAAPKRVVVQTAAAPERGDAVVLAVRAVAAASSPAKAARPAPLSEDDLYRRAAAAIRRSAYGVALADLKAAHALAPRDPRVLSAMGLVHDWLGRFDLSAHDYDLAEAADPGSPVVAINRRYSKILQRHGGAVVGAQMIAPGEAARPMVATSARSAGGQAKVAQRAPAGRGPRPEAPAG